MTKAITILAVLLLTCAAIAQADIVDRVEAVVNGKVITRYEVEKAMEVEALRRGVVSSEDSAKLRTEVLDTLIDRLLLLDEARKFNIVQVTSGEVDKALETIKKGFASQDEFEEALKKDEMTEEELRDDISDQILVAKYVDRRIKYFVRVTIDDQKEYYKQNVDKFGGKSFDEVNEEVYNLLLEMATDKKLEEYLRDLRAKSEIIIKGPEDQKPIVK